MASRKREYQGSATLELGEGHRRQARPEFGGGDREAIKTSESKKRLPFVKHARGSHRGAKERALLGEGHRGATATTLLGGGFQVHQGGQ
eukprot:CAMPEP_0174885624 /NCGR_PEP_ID=MMETSP0167-20121228/881_1 /TAXON_ID=38298 /ORGANISM="Rhodella maculata, Strain CCMP736" /LENGTH=88 /DNA_ID=CAMNT_0016121259 /DNA_START=112 /DNA_END=375 /DNA_ORIENTATION=-